ncbi:MAG: hypothetical protein KKF10_07350 [Verrucomicrobia bacterium]|nr:hypothetical protein [Verrucomicrobiota bacterium]
MRKVSAVMPVLIAGVVFSFVAIFLLAQEDQTTGRRVEREASSVERNAENEESAAVETENEEQGTANEERLSVPAVPEAPPANGKNGSAAGVVEISITSKTGAVPESVETNGDSTGAGAAAGTSLITVAFDNVPVQDVVNMFAQISGANIIMAGSFTNMFITANLKNVEWKSALNLALGSVNLSMIEDPSGILMVVTSEMYPKKLQEIEATKPLVTRTIVPRYLNAVDLVEQIKLFKVLSPRGCITTSQSAQQDKISLKSAPTIDALTIQNPSITTAIVITDIKEYVDKVEALIRVLDKREPQVFIEARIINVTSGDIKKLGVDWGMLDSFGAQAGLRDVIWNYDDEHSVDNEKTSKFDQYDKRSYQDDINKDYDINGQPIVNEPTRKITDKIGQERNIEDKRIDTILDTITQTRTATAFLNVDQVSLFLSALEKNSNAEMISHPQIVVGNRMEAKIHVGQKYPVLPTIVIPPTQLGGQYTYTDGEKEIVDLGLTLWVIPEIDFVHNTVRLTVRPGTATKEDNVINPQTGKTYPIVASRELTTRVNVPSGHTVAIGGLMENTTSKVEKKVPILGDIPLLGLLFRHTEDVVLKNNLIILITPTILDDSKPLTGLEAVAQLTIDKYEKIPLTAVKAVPSNTVAGVTIGTNAATPAAGMGQQASASNAPAATPVPAATTPANQ